MTQEEETQKLDNSLNALAQLMIWSEDKSRVEAIEVMDINQVSIDPGQQELNNAKYYYGNQEIQYWNPELGSLKERAQLMIVPLTGAEFYFNRKL